jgi:hypothetical protein
MGVDVEGESGRGPALQVVQPEDAVRVDRLAQDEGVAVR